MLAYSHPARSVLPEMEGTAELLSEAQLPLH